MKNGNLREITLPILFTFNDTKKIRIGNNVHLQKEWAVESILVAAEETIGLIPFGIHVCCINDQYYMFKQSPFQEEGAKTTNITHIVFPKKSL